MSKLKPETDNRKFYYSPEKAAEAAWPPQQYPPYDKKANLNGSFTATLGFCLLVAAFGGAFQFGWNIGVFNTPFDVIRNFYEEVYFERNNKTLSNETFVSLWSLTNGLMPLGGIFGGLSSGFFADYFGRKNGILLVNIAVIIGAIFNIVSKFVKSYETLMIGRFIGGLYSGLFSGILPMYLNECAPKNLRGLAGTMNQLFIVIGILVTNIFGLDLALGTKESWPILVGLVLIPASALFMMFCAVESPKYLFINKRNPEAAHSALVRLRGSSNVELISNELNELEQEKNNLMQTSSVSWADMFRKKQYVRPLIVTVGVQMLQQLSGINAVMFYSTEMFETALTDPWPSYTTIILGIVQLIMTFVCMAVVDRAGRKLLLLIGTVGMCISSFGIAMFRVLNQNSPSDFLGYLVIASAIIYIIFFAIGPGAIPWLITSELFGSDARGKATSIAVFINWGTNLLVTFTFPYLSEGIGNYSFIVFGVFLIFFTLFVLLGVPETKNKSIQEINYMFENNRFFLKQWN